ncbi:O-fucosyltransferase family protein [Striga hermonthica]|uniref:O-fucosyltransferase family protein n=1 Tax=Striga hermonthica TaxID=68872 RepID=A0A9N7N6S5_STRHE|nr:O-fucosyltransferase family protein [Striga hermonthica]
MALTYTAAEPTAARCRRRLHLHLKHRHKGFFSLFTGIFHKRYLLFLSIVYIVGLITCAGRLLAILHPPPPPPPGSLYRSQELFLKLWPEIESDNASVVELDNIWRYRRKKEQRTCSNGYDHQQLHSTVSLGTQRYLVVEANGGLNQQRSSICNAVAVAGLLNATLVIPRFDLHNVWKDPSGFADIYDEDHFISSLKDFVTVVQDLPKEIMDSYNYSISNIPNFRVQAWASARFYLDEVYPVLQESGVVRISPFANRLATSIPPQIQFLRCLANYKALKFSPTIMNLAKKVVSRMTAKSINSGGKYVSVHLRFEEDMVAFSCCVYDGGEGEKSELNSIREKGWAKKFMQKNRVFAPELNRVNGRCPMTPVEVGMMLRGMGFSNDTPIYLASGKIYKEEKYLEPLKKMFPLLYTKESLFTAEELSEIQGYSSRLAALDYMACLSSEVFVTTQGGNFPHFLMGHRRFLFNGHAKTIMPDKSKLVVLLQNTSLSWDYFKDEMETMLAESDRKSIMVPRVKKSTRKGSIYLNPLPECRCLWESQKSSTP